MLKPGLSCAMLLASTAAMPDAHAAPRICAADAVETRHSAQIGGRSLDYVACVGSLPVRNLKGQAHGRIVYTAYVVPGRSSRPLSFVWNGGPGADSRTLQFRAVGPRILKNGVLADNAASPLSVSDLVFVDPIGTGFSRADTPEHAAEFYGTNADIASVAGFVRDFRILYGRETSALNLVGESFGTWRASGVAETLVNQGIRVDGVALVSGGIPLGDEARSDRRRAVSLVNRTATAFALGRLAPDLQKDEAKTLAEVRHWAETVYAPALSNPAALDDASRAMIIARLARYQGLDPKTIDARTLWVSPRDFRTHLLASEGKTLGLFDMRKTSATSEGDDGKVVLDYYRRALGYTQGAYARIDAPDAQVGNDWQYDQSPTTRESLARAVAGEGPPSASQPWIQRAMIRAPKLRVWVATGMYDSLNSCPGNDLTVAGLPKSQADRFTLRCYAGGHMMYEDARQTLIFGHDLAAFLGAHA